VIEPFEGTRALAVYGNQFYSGKAAVISRGFGKGTVTYVGVDTDDGRLEQSVMRKIYQSAGIAVEDYPEGVFVDWRDGFWVAVNYSSTSYDFPLTEKAKIIIGDKKLDPADVLVWIE
jgi:beta-galactosidase